MACLEFACRNCNWMYFGNKPPFRKCPECGGSIVVFFDEDEHDQNRDRIIDDQGWDDDE